MNDLLLSGFERVGAWLAGQAHAPVPRWLDVPARTVAEAARALGIAPGQVAKSVVFRRPGDDAAVLVVCSGDLRVDLRKVGNLLGPVVRADADFVRARTGFSIGGVAPVAHPTPVVVVIDRELMRFDEVWAAAGHPQGVFCAAPVQLLRLTGAALCDVAEDVVSPCIEVCRIDPARGWCEGCHRTLDEIAAWPGMSESERRTLLDLLFERRHRATREAHSG